MAVVGVELRRAAAGRLVTLALPRYWQARLEVLLRGLPVLPFDGSAAVATTGSLLNVAGCPGAITIASY